MCYSLLSIQHTDTKGEISNYRYALFSNHEFCVLLIFAVGSRPQTLERESIKKPTVVEQKFIPISTFLISIFARNSYRFKLSAPVLAFMTNFLLPLLLLFFYRIEKRGPGAEGAAEETAIDTSFVTSLTDTISSIADSFKTRKSTCSLVIFKWGRKYLQCLNFKGIWIAEQPSDEGLGAQWDKLVLPTSSFPHMCWEMFVKKIVLKKYQEQYDQQQMKQLLGIKTGSSNGRLEEVSNSWFYLTRPQEMDLQYLLWKGVVIFTDNVAFHCFCTLWSILLSLCCDVAISFKALATNVQSYAHNGKQV
ncbi:Ryanodine receptor 2, partial [Taenia solium]